MFTIARISLLFLLAVALRGQSSLENARYAQALLGPDVWSQVITVRNDSRGGPYPKTVHALVFELLGILWFYTDIDGTQSFSLRHDNLEQEKRDFAPLLRDIDPGFSRWKVVAEAASPLGERRTLLNGCFIESVVALRERLGRGLRTDDARLLSYYANTPRGMNGHTVLMVTAGDRIEVFDPARPGDGLVFEKAAAGDALALARALDGKHIEKARYLPLRTSAGSELFAVTAGVESRQARVQGEESVMSM